MRAACDPRSYRFQASAWGASSNVTIVPNVVTFEEVPSHPIPNPGPRRHSLCQATRHSLSPARGLNDTEPREDDRIAAYRAGLLERIAGVIVEGGEEGVPGRECSPLVAEGLAGAVVSILGTRLSLTGRRAAGGTRNDAPPKGPLSDLLGELMALVVLPYLGPEAAREERDRPLPAEPETAPLPVPAQGSKKGGKYLPLDVDHRPGSQLRMTYRTALVLEAIAQVPGISNLGVARHAQINDQGQISKLLSRLERNGLVQNTGRGQSQGAPNEWRLTPAGQQVERGIREQRQAA
jgi:DNA-binding MarR family transcriptional regulator